MTDKIPVIIAIVVLAILATYKPEKVLLDFLVVLASGLFGLVTGVEIGKRINSKKAEDAAGN